MVKEEKIFSVVDSAGKVHDGFDNFVSRLGLNNDNTLSAGLYTFNLMTRNRIQLEAAYRGSWIVGQVVDTVAEDMTKAGIEITTSEAEDDIADINSAISKLQLWNSFCTLIKWGRLYGGAMGFIQIKGQDPKTPLRIETIGKGQFIGLAVYDRWQLNPVLGEIVLEGPDIGLPKYYQIVTGWDSSSPQAPTVTGQVTVHHSRVIRNIGIQLPFFQAITEMMWGESILERLWDRLISFDSATMSCANLIERASNRMVGVDGLREILAAGEAAQAALEAQFNMMRKMQTNEGITLLDKNDVYQSDSYSFSGLDAVMLQFGQQLSGASGIPLVRLFGQSPAGLSATGESDIRMYYDNINSQQESRLRVGWDTLLKVLWRSTYGRAAPSDLEFTFNSLWQMSALDQATVAKTTTETIEGAETAGLINKGTALQELRKAAPETGLFSTITDEEIAEAKEEPEDPPNPDLEVDPDAPGKGSIPIPPGKPNPSTKADGSKSLDSRRGSPYERIKKWVGL